MGRAPVRELCPRRGRKILIYSSNLITFSKKNDKIWSLHQSITPSELFPQNFPGQSLANSMHRIKRYAHFCEMFQQIVTDHFAARFPLLLCYKVLLFETRKHYQSLQAIWINSLVGRAPVRELSPRRGRKILSYSSNLITFSKKMSKFDHHTIPWTGHNFFHRMFLNILDILFESYTFFLSSGQLLANSMHRIKRYAHFSEIFQQIVTDHFAARFP